MYAAGSKAGGVKLSQPLTEAQNISHGATRFGICPVLLQSCLDQYFLTICRFFLFRAGMFILCHYLLNVCSLLEIHMGATF